MQCRDRCRPSRGLGLQETLQRMQSPRGVSAWTHGEVLSTGGGSGLRVTRASAAPAPRRYCRLALRGQSLRRHQLRQLPDLCGRWPTRAQWTPGCSGACGCLLPTQTGLATAGHPVCHACAAGAGGPARSCPAAMICGFIYRHNLNERYKLDFIYNGW